MQMNIKREKTSNALEWQHAIEQRAEATKGIWSSSWIGLKVMLHKSVCLNPIYILFHIIFYLYFFSFYYDLFSNPSSEILSTFHLKLKFESVKGGMTIQYLSKIIKDSQIPLASPHFTINDVTAWCSPTFSCTHKLLLLFQSEVVFACWSSNISCTELLRKNMHMILEHRSLPPIWKYPTLIVHKRIATIIAEFI